MRSGASLLGPAEAWSKELDGEAIMLEDPDDAGQLAEQYNRNTHSCNVHYTVRKMEPGMAAAIIQRRLQKMSGPEMSGPV